LRSFTRNRFPIKILQIDSLLISHAESSSLFYTSIGFLKINSRDNYHCDDTKQGKHSRSNEQRKRLTAVLSFSLSKNNLGYRMVPIQNTDHTTDMHLPYVVERHVLTLEKSCTHHWRWTYHPTLSSVLREDSCRWSQDAAFAFTHFTASHHNTTAQPGYKTKITLKGNCRNIIIGRSGFERNSIVDYTDVPEH